MTGRNTSGRKFAAYNGIFLNSLQRVTYNFCLTGMLFTGVNHSAVRMDSHIGRALNTGNRSRLAYSLFLCVKQVAVYSLFF